MGLSSEEQDPQTYAIIGAAIEVHRELGAGFLELVYQEALANEFGAKNIPFDREKTFSIRYKESILNAFFKPDFICFGAVIVELKALPELGGLETAKTLNYLKATGISKALLLNFGESKLTYRRFRM